MIIRQWRGLAKKNRLAAYVTHFRDEVLPRLRSLAGFCGATVLQLERPHGVEVTVLIRWKSMEAVRAFAGRNLEVAVVAEAAQPCFHSYENTVSHHEVIVDEDA